MGKRLPTERKLTAWLPGAARTSWSLKTVEMVADFRRSPAQTSPLNMCDSPVKTVESFRFLGTIIAQDLRWAENITSTIKKAQQRMFFLRQLKKFNMPQKVMAEFYIAIIESILTSSITVWFTASTAKDKGRLQRIFGQLRRSSAATCRPSYTCSTPGPVREQARSLLILPIPVTTYFRDFHPEKGFGLSRPKPRAT